MIDFWRSVADADASHARWEHDAAVRQFMALLDRSSVNSERYRTPG